MKILAIIPARGGSKRIPSKNIRFLCGKPIIAYTIEAAKQSGLFDRVVVSTDNNDIASAAQKSGAEVPFLRQASLADDQTPISLVTYDTLRRLDSHGYLYSYVAQLMPNCPLRTPKDVVASYRQFTETNSESQISVARYSSLNPWWAMIRDDQYRLTAIFQDKITARSQDLPEVFYPTGAIWWIKAEVLRQKKTFHTTSRTGWEIPWSRAVDIDTEDDWQLAELLMEAQHKILENAD